MSLILIPIEKSHIVYDGKCTVCEKYVNLVKIRRIIGGFEITENVPIGMCPGISNKHRNHEIN